MTESKKERHDEQEQASAELQQNAMKEFLEEKTGSPRNRGPVQEDTSRLPDDQNRMISEHNLRK